MVQCKCCHTYQITCMKGCQNNFWQFSVVGFNCPINNVREVSFSCQHVQAPIIPLRKRIQPINNISIPLSPLLVTDSHAVKIWPIFSTSVTLKKLYHPGGRLFLQFTCRQQYLPKAEVSLQNVHTNLETNEPLKICTNCKWNNIASNWEETVANNDHGFP